uniref:hypothetical protein n=1 Tax=Escherichia sp. MOD1-EC7003 TaxID=2093900 RepID=UPI001A7E10C7
FFCSAIIDRKETATHNGSARGDRLHMIFSENLSYYISFIEQEMSYQQQGENMKSMFLYTPE